MGSSSYSSNIFCWEASGSDPTNLDNHIKPLDIIKVRKKHKTWGVEYTHIGVYLGKNQVFHIYHPRKTELMRARIDDFERFVEDNNTSVRISHLIVCHPIIPFKHHEKIVEHIVKADWKDFWNGRYCLANRNCEHLANMVVYGINYSKQVKDDPRAATFCFSPDCLAWRGGCKNDEGNLTKKGNNNKGSTINLKNEITETTKRLDNLTDLNFENMRSEYEARIQVPPKKDCRIM